MILNQIVMGKNLGMQIKQIRLGFSIFIIPFKSDN